jgi:hypothetical protein
MSVADKSQKKSGGLGETISVIVQALLLALVIRTFLFQPFSIPSGSMRPTLLEGDYLFVTKWAYGYSRYSFPFSPPIFSGRIWGSEPERGDDDRCGEGGLVAVGERRQVVGALGAGHGDGGQDRHTDRRADLERGVVQARCQPGLGLGHAGQRRDRARDEGGADADAEEGHGEDEVREVAAADRHLRQRQAAQAGERHGDDRNPPDAALGGDCLRGGGPDQRRDRYDE